VKANGIESDSHGAVSSQKYSQILGDLHTNSSTQHTRSASHQQYKSRGYTNKENFYNQRNGGRPGLQRNWQRGGNYRTPLVNGKDRRDESEKPLADAKFDSTAEPRKFNEGETFRKQPQASYATSLSSPQTSTLVLRRRARMFSSRKATFLA
jgi:hypothetical protein